MSLITVERFIHHPDCEIGRVYINGELFCFSIEDAFRTTKFQEKPVSLMEPIRWEPAGPHIFQKVIITR